jgi:hypothetical protein
MFSQMLKVGQDVSSESARAVLASTVLEIERNQHRIHQAAQVSHLSDPNFTVLEIERNQHRIRQAAQVSHLYQVRIPLFWR